MLDKLDDIFLNGDLKHSLIAQHCYYEQPSFYFIRKISNLKMLINIHNVNF